MMKYSEQFMEHIEYTFAAFCKVVLRNAAISAYRDFGRKQKHEVSLDYLMSETSFEPFATDNYFEQYVYEKPTVFVVQGKEVVGILESTETLCTDCRDRERYYAAYSAAFVCCTSDPERSRLKKCAGDVGTFGYIDNADVSEYECV